MKILVTVGTTAFDNLIRAADEQLSQNHELIFQISEGNYKPSDHQYFEFTDDIESYYLDADLIISHGGAGTIYRILELGKKLIIVPNLDRVDHHQLDICKFMQKNKHAVVCMELEQLTQVAEEIENMTFVPFHSDEFTGIDKIREYFQLS